MIKCCPICESEEHELVCEKSLPLTVMASLAASAPQNELFEVLTLVRCTKCSHLFNRRFEESLVSKLYVDTPLSNLPVHPSMFSRFEDLITWLNPAIYENKDVIEIGAGCGHLARLIAQKAQSVLVYEPNVHLQPCMMPEKNILLKNELFPLTGASRKVDFVICRQVLEHVSNPAKMIQSCRTSLNDGGYAYLEIPSAEYIIKYAPFTDIHLQHVQYYTLDNFVALAARAGFQMERVLSIKDGHDMGVLFKAVPTTVSSSLSSSSLTQDLSRKLESRITKAQKIMADIASKGNAALYGATQHTQIFLSAVEKQISFSAVLDDNKCYEGYACYDRNHFIPVEVATPEKALQYKSIVIGAYLHDLAIANKLRDWGFKGQIYSIRPFEVPTNNAEILGLYTSGF